MGFLSSIGNLVKGVAGSIIGGAFGNKAADKAQDSAIKQQEMNIAYQKEFAQKGIQWRTEDAKAAGVHPLFAMGATTPSYTPIVVDDYKAQNMANMGQDIGRAVHATLNPADQRLSELAIQRELKQQQLLDAQIQQTRIDSFLRLKESTQQPGVPAVNSGNEVLDQDATKALVKDAATWETLTGDTAGLTQIIPQQHVAIRDQQNKHLTPGHGPLFQEKAVFTLDNGKTINIRTLAKESGLDDQEIAGAVAILLGNATHLPSEVWNKMSKPGWKLFWKKLQSIVDSNSVKRPPAYKPSPMLPRRSGSSGKW